MVTSLVGKNIERPSVFCYGVSAEKVFGLQMVNTVSHAFLQVYHLLLLFKHMLKCGVYLPVCARRGFLLFPQMTIQAFHPFDERPIFFSLFPIFVFLRQVAQATLQLLILSSRPLKYWDYRPHPPCPAHTPNPPSLSEALSSWNSPVWLGLFLSFSYCTNLCRES